MKVEILDEARDDLIDGFHFYESQVPGLGDYFLESLFSDIESLRLHAGIHPMVYRYHRLLARRFPYAIYYTLRDNADGHALHAGLERYFRFYNNKPPHSALGNRTPATCHNTN